MSEDLLAPHVRVCPRNGSEGCTDGAGVCPNTPSRRSYPTLLILVGEHLLAREIDRLACLIGVAVEFQRSRTLTGKNRRTNVSEPSAKSDLGAGGGAFLALDARVVGRFDHGRDPSDDRVVPYDLRGKPE